MSSPNSDGNAQDGKILPFQMNHLPDFFRKKGERELNETPENKKVKMQELKTMLAGNQATSGFNFEEDFLLQYLRHGKYDVQRAFKQILNYVCLRGKQNSLFQSIPDHHFLSGTSTEVVLPLPNRTADGCTIFMTRMGKWNPSEMDYEDFTRLYIMFMCQVIRDPMTQINGFKTIHCFKNTTWAHFKFCSPWRMHFFVYASLDCVPARFKEMHFVNESFVMRALWMIIKRFLSEKIRNRVFFHKNVEELLEYFPRSVLPVDFGGDLQVDSMKDWVRKANKDHQTNTIKGQPNLY